MICGRINEMFRNIMKKCTKTKLYKSKSNFIEWHRKLAITKKDDRKIESAGMEFIDNVKSCILIHKVTVEK